MTPSISTRPSASTPTCPAGGDDFQPDVRAALDAFIGSVDPSSRPVAVFDWDNTVIKNDIGAATVFHMVRQGLVRRPADWGDFSDLTDAARQRLAAACAGDGELLPSRTNRACADLLARLYKKGKLPEDPAPFKPHNHRTYRPTTAWQAHLLAGYTPAQVRAMARDAIQKMCAAPVGATAEVGGLKVEGYLRLHRAMLGLMKRLRERGFAVWVVSASPQQVVEAFGEVAGIPRERVVGIRSVLDRGGRLTHKLQGCGQVKDGENRLLTYLDGKRCWIKKIIGRQPALVAGDATTDLTMLRDAAGLRLVIDRGYPELMCHALHGKWVINPMLYEPAPARKALYPCSTSACMGSGGEAVPCKGDDGQVLADIN